jgi:ribosome-binding factor A
MADSKKEVATTEVEVLHNAETHFKAEVGNEVDMRDYSKLEFTSDYGYMKKGDIIDRATPPTVEMYVNQAKVAKIIK